MASSTKQAKKEIINPVDLIQNHNEEHYAHYKNGIALVKESQEQLDNALETMDGKIIGCIRDNEETYHNAVMKYLKDKEQELKNVLYRLDAKNNQNDSKDLLIGKLHALVSKIESDGQTLLDKLRQNEDETRLMKEAMHESTQDRSFMVEKLKKEKRTSRKQENLIKTLKDKNDRLEAAFKVKEEEIKKLELKLMR